MAADKITRSLRKMKEKAVKRGQWPGRGYAKGAVGIKDIAPEEDLGRLSMDEPTDDEVESATARLGSLPDSVKRTKVFYLDPMTVEVRDRIFVALWCTPMCCPGAAFPKMCGGGVMETGGSRRVERWGLCRKRSISWTWWTMTSICTWTRPQVMFKLCTSGRLEAMA